MAKNGNGATLLLDPKPRYDDEVEEYNPTKSQQQTIDTVERYYSQKKIVKNAYEKTWFISHAAIVGQHYLVWNDLNRAFEVPMRVPTHRVRMVVNLILPYWRRSRARLTAHRPVLHVAPATSDEADVERARLSERVLEAEFDRLRFQEIFKEYVGWGLEAGNVFWGLRWDPWAGRALTEEKPIFEKDPELGIDLPKMDEQGKPVTQRVPVEDEHGRQLHIGETVLDVVSPYEIEIDPRATDMGNANWLMRNSVRTIEWIREHYPENGKYVRAEQVWLHSFYLKRHKQLVGIYGYSSEAGGEQDKHESMDAAVVHEYWERPTFKYPKGRLVVTANRVLLYDGINPYDKLLDIGFWAPYIHFVEIKVPGRFWGMSTIEQLFPLNRNLNRARSQEVENRQLHGRPKIMVPRTSKIRQSAFDAEAGEKVEYTPGPRGEKPEQIYPQSTTKATESEIGHTITDMQEVGSWHEATRGIMPSANAPAAAIDKLQQADETVLGDTEGHLRDAVIQLSRMILAMSSQFWTEERIVKVTGDDGLVFAQTVRGDAMYGAGEEDYFDVRMIPQSSMWKDPVRQRSMLADLIKLQILSPIRDRSVILKLLEAQAIDDVFVDDKQDRQWACRENQLMEQAQQSEPRDFENHEMHIKEHNRFRKSERYRRLPQQAQMVFDEHVQMHQDYIVAIQQKVSLMQMEGAQDMIGTQHHLDQMSGGGGAGGGPEGGGGPPSEPPGAGGPPEAGQEPEPQSQPGGP